MQMQAVNNSDLQPSHPDQPPETERVWDKSPYFNHYNRNKYGCSLDLASKHGRELFLRLVAISDIVIDNFRTEVMDNLGLSYEALRAVNEAVVYVSHAGHGKPAQE